MFHTRHPRRFDLLICIVSKQYQEYHSLLVIINPLLHFLDRCFRGIFFRIQLMDLSSFFFDCKRVPRHFVTKHLFLLFKSFDQILQVGHTTVHGQR